MFYRRQGIEWGDTTGVYTGNVPGLVPPQMPARCYAFRGHRVPRALTFEKENMYHWSVKDLVAAIRGASGGDIDYTCRGRSGDVRSKVWKFAGGIWVCGIENGATCGHGTAAARARAFGKQRVSEVRDVWGSAGIIVDDDKGTPLLYLERFTRLYGRLHLAIDSYRCREFRKDGPLPPRYGRFLCHCSDYASYESCVFVVSLQYYAMHPLDDPWAPTQKIRKGVGEAPAFTHALRRDIRLRLKSAAEAYKRELDPTSETQQDEVDSSHASSLQ